MEIIIIILIMTTLSLVGNLFLLFLLWYNNKKYNKKFKELKDKISEYKEKTKLQQEQICVKMDIIKELIKEKEKRKHEK